VEIRELAVTQILREINFRDCRFSNFGKFQASKSIKNHKKSKFRASKFVKTADFALLESPKLISRKI